jgi:hypothetical protein
MVFYLAAKKQCLPLDLLVCSLFITLNQLNNNA